ncbi:MAG TPA: DUF5666 domain-containing protein [Bryobacteraceae bacterium]|nr:DUF5666 domain-containing protein [Bryobacteraceae bacterium]
MIRIDRRQFAALAIGGSAVHGIAPCARAGFDAPATVELIGAVQRVSAKGIDVRSGGELVTVHADVHSEIWRGRNYPDFSQFEAGDQIRAKCRKDDSGKLIAVSVFANWTKFSGTITGGGGDKLEVLTDPSSETPSTTFQEHKVVYLGFDTVLEAGTRKDLKKGRSVQITGLDLRNGSVQATRVVLR